MATSLLDKLGVKKQTVKPGRFAFDVKPYQNLGKRLYEEEPLNEQVQGLQKRKEQDQAVLNAPLVSKLPKKNDFRVQTAETIKQKFGVDVADKSIAGLFRKAAAELRMNADQRKEYGQLLLDYIQSEVFDKPIRAGIVEGAHPLDATKNLREKAPEQTRELEKSPQFIGGKVAGTIGQYASMYNLLGPVISGAGTIPTTGGIGAATGTLAPTLTQKLAYGLGSGVAGTVVTELAKDVAIGGTLGAIDAISRGDDVAKTVAENILMDIGFNIAGAGIGKAFKSVKEAVETAKKAKTTEVVEQVAKSLNLPTTEASKVIDDQIENSIMKSEMRTDATSINLRQPVQKQQDIYLHSTNKQFENFEPSNDGLVYFSKDNKTGKTIADLIFAKNEKLHPNAPKYRIIKSTFDTDKVKIFDPFDDENAKKIAKEFGLPTDRSTIKWDEISRNFTERIKKDGYNVVQILEPNGNTSYAVADTSIIKQITPQPTIDRPSEFAINRKKLTEKIQEPTTPTRTMAEDIGLRGNQIDEAIPTAEAVQIPSDSTTLKERGFSENIRTDANRIDELRKELDADPEFYNQLSNTTTLESAQARFGKGYEQALKDFDNTKSQLRADNVPLAKLIADEAARRGDMQTARRVIVEVAENLTTAGQYSQAAKILRESNDPVTVLRFVQKEIDKLNQQGLKRYGKGGGLIKGWKKIELTDDELALINSIGKNATDEQKEVLFNQLFNSVAQRIPTTAREKFDSWRRIAMLFNPKTHIRNILGNTIMKGVKAISDKTAQGLELALPVSQRTKGTGTKQLKELAENYFEANRKQLTEGSRWEIFGVGTPFADKPIFKTGWLNTLNDISKKTLEGEDLFFFKRNFINDLAGFMNARGLKEPTQEAIDYALRRSQEATFRQANAIATSINKLKGSRFGLIVDAAVPFTKTPANILQTGIDYSPIGVVKSAVSLLGNAEPSVAIETLSKGLTGSALSLMGYYSAMNGLARGEYESNKRVEGLYQATGMLPNSIKTPNGSYTIDWAQPASMPFFMGVAFAEKMKEGGDDKLQAGFDALVAGGESLVNQSMLSGIKDLFGGYGTMTEKILQLPINYVTQGFPTVAGQIARVIDPTKRQADYSNIATSTLTGLQARTPIASQALPEKFDILGKPQVYGTGLKNAFIQFLSPGFVGEASKDPVVIEIERLYKEVGNDFLPKYGVTNFTAEKQKYNLTNKERSELQRIMGEYTANILKSMMQTSDYRVASNEEKAKMIKKVNEKGYDLAKAEIVKARSK